MHLNFIGSGSIANYSYRASSIHRSISITTPMNEVKVTQHGTSSNGNSNDESSSTIHSTQFLHNNDKAMKLVDNLLLRTSDMMDPHSANVVAYSGGVDSSLVAALVYRAYSDYQMRIHHEQHHSNSSSSSGSVQAVLGISHAVPQSQIIMARTVAETIGIPLTEVTTSEGSDETYQRNDGYACYVCKTHLYSTLETVANTVMEQQHQQQQRSDDNGSSSSSSSSSHNNSVLLYNGTNTDDTQDPTRLGLIAASNFQVHSPLDQITKDQVREAAKYLGLPNWNAAASPCLRSRLAMGVLATQDHLRAVELAEEFVRRVLKLDESVNARVRMLAGGKAMVELDDTNLLQFGSSTTGGPDEAQGVLQENGFEQLCIDEWGFKSFGGVRGFKTGSVAAMPAEENRELPAAAL